MPYFQEITLTDWRQFQDLHIDLSQQVTVITGQNGTGKTTLLTILARHFGWNTSFISTPYWSEKRQRRFWSDVYRSRRDDLADESAGNVQVGHVAYSDGEMCPLHVNRELASAQYKLKYGGQRPVTGLHIPSHRLVASYHNVSTIPTDPKTIEQHYQEFQQLVNQTYMSENAQNPGVAQKKSLIALALFGYGNQAVRPNPEYREMFEGFQEILKKVLPRDVGFERLEVRMPEVVLVTKSGTFALEAMSGGINALFSVAWQIFMYGAGRAECTVTLDEPENHLHPSMQRSFLPSLAAAFPDFRFVVATHSPFVVTSFPESNVYGLVFTPEARVTAAKLDVRDLSGTPNRVLREILDVPSNLPVWVEEQVRDLMRETADLSPEAQGARLLALLDELGIGDALVDLDPESFEGA